MFKKHGVYCNDYYISVHHERERIGLDKWLANIGLCKRRVRIAEGGLDRVGLKPAS